MEGARSGQWTSEEVVFATRLIDEFRNGSLDLAEGTSMRGFLADKLGCIPKRISKKYENTNYNGRLQYVRDKTLSAEECVRRRLDLEKLERAFRESINEGDTPKVAAKKEKARKQKVSKTTKAPPSKEPVVAETEFVRAQRKLQQEKEQEMMQLQRQQMQQQQQQQQQKLPARTLSSSAADPSDRLWRASANPSGGTAQAALMAVADLQSSLKRNAQATSAANDELASLVAARQRLAQQSLALRQATLRQEIPSINDSLASARANQLLNSLSSLQQQQPPPQPLPGSASIAQNTSASRVERLRFLRQIELEQEQRNQMLASTSTTTASTTVPAHASLPVPAAAPKWTASMFHKQAKLMAAKKKPQQKQPLMASQKPQPMMTRDFLEVASRKQAAHAQPATAFAARLSKPFAHGNTNNSDDNNNSFKRKQAPTFLLPDPKRPRHFY